MVPGQSYLFKIAEELSFVLCIIPAVSVSRLSSQCRYNLVVHLPAAHRLQLLQSTVFFLFISWPPGLTLLPVCTQLSIQIPACWYRILDSDVLHVSRIYDRCGIVLLGFP